MRDLVSKKKKRCRAIEKDTLCQLLTFTSTCTHKCIPHIYKQAHRGDRKPWHRKKHLRITEDGSKQDRRALTPGSLPFLPAYVSL